MTDTLAVVADATPVRRSSLTEAMTAFVVNAYTIRGRASRSQFWWWMLVNVVVLALSQLLIPFLVSGRTPQPTLQVGPFGSWLFADIELFTTHSTDAPSSPLAATSLLFAGLWLIATLIPGFTVAVRRLHDSNLSGWWVLLAFLSFGPFILLLLATRRSRPDGIRFDA